jgi:hypothetical protein
VRLRLHFSSCDLSSTMQGLRGILSRQHKFKCAPRRPNRATRCEKVLLPIRNYVSKTYVRESAFMFACCVYQRSINMRVHLYACTRVCMMNVRTMENKRVATLYVNGVAINMKFDLHIHWCLQVFLTVTSTAVHCIICILLTFTIVVRDVCNIC